MGSPGFRLGEVSGLINNPAHSLQTDQSRHPASLWAPEALMLTTIQNKGTQVLGYPPSPICDDENQVALPKPPIDQVKTSAFIRMLMGFPKQKP